MCVCDTGKFGRSLALSKERDAIFFLWEIKRLRGNRARLEKIHFQFNFSAKDKINFLRVSFSFLFSIIERGKKTVTSVVVGMVLFLLSSLLWKLARPEGS